MLWEVIWRNRTSFSLTFCLGFSLLGLIWQGNFLSKGVGAVGKMADRISGALNSGLRFTDTVWVEIDRYRELEKRYAAAQELLQTYKLEKDKFDLLKLENDKLRKAMGFAARQDYPEIKAEVLSIRLNSISPRVVIGKGRQDGIAPMMPVIATAHDKDQNQIRCVLGIVIAADNSTSVVQPLVHPSFRLGVRIPDSGQWAILSGNSGNITETLLTYISVDESANQSTMKWNGLEVKLGRQVVTSGEGGVFPPNIPVGTISREGTQQAEYKTAYVRPFVPLDGLDYVTVLLKKVEPWAPKWDKEEISLESLMTEFGAPIYSEFTKRPPKVQSSQASEQEKPDNAGSDAGSSRETPDSSQQRKLQNVIIPTPGN